jgi:hypothetical protein
MSLQMTAYVWHMSRQAQLDQWLCSFMAGVAAGGTSATTLLHLQSTARSVANIFSTSGRAAGGLLHNRQECPD